MRIIRVSNFIHISYRELQGAGASSNSIQEQLKIFNCRFPQDKGLNQ